MVFNPKAKPQPGCAAVGAVGTKCGGAHCTDAYGVGDLTMACQICQVRKAARIVRPVLALARYACPPPPTTLLRARRKALAQLAATRSCTHATLTAPHPPMRCCLSHRRNRSPASSRSSPTPPYASSTPSAPAPASGCAPAPAARLSARRPMTARWTARPRRGSAACSKSTPS